MLLSYKVAAATSESDDHPVRELQSFHAQSRGWQSSRWCDYPQELVLQFPGKVTLQQVQVLSHQFKIASRVELFMGAVPPGVPAPVSGAAGVKFTRLGHFSLDSNERSGYQARELKTVYVPRATEGTYLKLVLHKCHINEHNLYNQLGLLAVRAIGSGPGAAGASPVDPLALQASSQPPEEPRPDEPRGASMDPAVVAMVRELEEQKKAAVGGEDYDEAKRLKVRMDELKRLGVQLAEMERKKVSAVANEDYDTAKDIKDQLNELRLAHGVPLPAAPPPAVPAIAARAGYGGRGGLGGPSEELKDQMELERAAAQARIEQMAKRAGVPPPARPQPPPVYEYDNLPPPQGSAAHAPSGSLEGGMGSPSAPGPSAAAAMGLGGVSGCSSMLAPTSCTSSMAADGVGGYPAGSIDSLDPAQQQQYLQQQMAAQQQQQQQQQQLLQSQMQEPPPMAGGGGSPGASPGASLGASLDGRQVGPGGGRRLHGDETPLGAPPPDAYAGDAYADAEAPEAPGASPRASQGACAASGSRAPRATNQKDHEERPVGRAVDFGPEQPGSISEDLPPPEALSPADEKDAGTLIDLFGEHLVRCLYSRVWNLRQAAVVGMTELIQTPNFNLPADGRSIVQACCKVVGRCCADKMVQVYLAGMGLFTAIFQLPAVNSLPRQEWQQLLAPLTPQFLGKLGDGNVRVREASEAALLATCRLQQVGPLPVATALTAPLEPKKQSDVRLQLGRLSLLSALLSEFGPQLREMARELLRMLKSSLESSRDTVRAKATEVAQQLYGVVGDLNLIASFLPKDLNPQTRDHLLAALEEAGASPQPPRPGASGPPTIPPSPSAQSAGSGRGVGGRGGGGGPAAPSDEAAAADEPPLDEHTCQFCGVYNPSFTEEKLDLHFWKECPMLMPCEQCGQIVEVVGLNEHILAECDQSQAFRYQPPLGIEGYRGCPLCALELPDDLEAAKFHLAHECQGNLRRSAA